MATRRYEYANRAWNVLAEMAGARETLSYGTLAARIGLSHPRPIPRALAPIQDLCQERMIPPLTILAYSKSTGMPGSGFTAWSLDDLEGGRRKVWEWNWSKEPEPFLQGFRQRLGHMARGRSRRGTETPGQFRVDDHDARVNGRGSYQAMLRRVLLEAYDRCCALCDTRLKEVLVASHIVRWADDPDNRCNPANALLLCANHDRLFDTGLMRVKEDGSVAWRIPAGREPGSTLVAFRATTRASLRQPKQGYAANAQFLRRRFEQR